MYNLEIENIYTDKKFCLCGCGRIIDEENWGIKIKVHGEVESIKETIELIEQFEYAVNNLSKKSLVCNYCGKCCNYGPEITKKELEYYIKNFPEYENLYKQIKSGENCPAGGIEKGPCCFSKDARPFQCRLLYCEANIVGFESFYNFIGKYFNWSSV